MVADRRSTPGECVFILFMVLAALPLIVLLATKTRQEVWASVNTSFLYWIFHPGLLAFPSPSTLSSFPSLVHPCIPLFLKSLLLLSFLSSLIQSSRPLGLCVLCLNFKARPISHLHTCISLQHLTPPASLVFSPQVMSPLRLGYQIQELHKKLFFPTI